MLGFSISVLLAAFVTPTQALDNGVGLKPPMGYNTWNDMGCANINEENVKGVADAMVAKGLVKAGFAYLNLDDCWMADVRDEDGKLQADKSKFPSGMASLADYLHSKGMKLGIYTDRGDETCQGRPGSLGNETLDAQTFADWGVDYLKEDNCHSSTGPDDKDVLFRQFGLMRDALNRTGRPIIFSVCGGGDHPAGDNISYYATDLRGGAKLANSWRISGDVITWSTFLSAVQADIGLERFAGPGGFNDPDMLLGSTLSFEMTEAQSRTQFSLLAVISAPLLIGTNVQRIKAYDLATYTNTEVIAVSQDSLMKQGTRIMSKTLSKPGVYPELSVSVWARQLSGGDIAMVFLNANNHTTTIACDGSCWAKLAVPASTKFEVRDLWSHGPASDAHAMAGQEYSVRIKDGLGASMMLLFQASVSAALIV